MHQNSLLRFSPPLHQPANNITMVATTLAMVATEASTVNPITAKPQRNLSRTHGLRQEPRSSLPWTSQVGTARISNTRSLGGNTSPFTAPDPSWPSALSSLATCSSPSSLVKPLWSTPASPVLRQTQATYSASENGATWATNAQTAAMSSTLSKRWSTASRTHTRTWLAAGSKTPRQTPAVKFLSSRRCSFRTCPARSLSLASQSLSCRSSPMVITLPLTAVSLERMRFPPTWTSVSRRIRQLTRNMQNLLRDTQHLHRDTIDTQHLHRLTILTTPHQLIPAILATTICQHRPRTSSPRSSNCRQPSVHTRMNTATTKKSRFSTKLTLLKSKEAKRRKIELLAWCAGKMIQRHQKRCYESLYERSSRDC